MQPRILGVSGSLRPDSLSRRALVLALDFAATRAPKPACST